MHWCAEETAAVAVILGGGGAVGVWVKVKWYTIKGFFTRKFHVKSSCPCGHEGNELHQ